MRISDKVGIEGEWRKREGSREEVGREGGQGEVSWAAKHHKPKQRE